MLLALFMTNACWQFLWVMVHGKTVKWYLVSRLAQGWGLAIESLKPCLGFCRYFEDRMGWTITNIWNLITYDVEDVVYKVATQVLTEEDVSKEEIKLRAEALKEIGEIFQVIYKNLSPSPFGIWLSTLKLLLERHVLFGTKLSTTNFRFFSSAGVSILNSQNNMFVPHQPYILSQVCWYIVCESPTSWAKIKKWCHAFLTWTHVFLSWKHPRVAIYIIILDIQNVWYFQSAKRRGSEVTITKGVHDERLAEEAKLKNKEATSGAIEQDVDKAASKTKQGAKSAEQAGKDALDQAKQTGNKALDKVWIWWMITLI